jgi:hypothetical protein
MVRLHVKIEMNFSSAAVHSEMQIGCQKQRRRRHTSLSLSPLPRARENFAQINNSPPQHASARKKG